jgi:hypothetical protein
MVLTRANLIPEPPMLVSVAELQPALHDLFNGAARDLAKLTGFCQRTRDLNGDSFAKALVFCLLETPTATLDDFAEFADEHLDLEVCPNAFDERFGPASARFLFALLLHAFEFSFTSARAALLPVLRRFKGVYLRDATSVRLPPCMARLMPGRKGRADVDQAAAKLVLEVEVTTGRFTEFSFLAGTANEKTAEVSAKPLPKGSLLLEDMGFLSGERLQGFVEQGVYVLTRVPCWTAFYVKKGERFERLNLLKWLRKARGCYAQRLVHVFHKEKVPMRLLASRVPDDVAEARRERVRREAKERGRQVSQKKLELCEWNVLLTNAPSRLISVHQACDVRRVRWQVELVFKVFKSEAKVGHSRSEDGWRVLTELFAKLLGQAVQQWLLLAAGYVMLKHSARRAARRVRKRAAKLLAALGDVRKLARQLVRLAVALHRYCKVKRRRKTPSTLDRLAALDHEYRCLEQAL